MEFPTNIKDLADKCFDRYDKDGSCYIEHAELKKLLTDVSNQCGLPIPSDADVDRIKQDADINNDNKISRKEFLDLYKVIWQIQNPK